MIFVTVGSDVPFDRLIRVVDQWARSRGRRDVFAQIGRGGWEPEFVEFSHMLDPSEFRHRLAACDLVIAHAGMGTILSCLQASKPILVMPRRGHLGETRNDHQMATARHLLGLGKVDVAFDEEELLPALDRLDALSAREPISPYAGPQLLETVRRFILGDKPSLRTE